MRRSRPPIETVIAISVLAIAMLAGVGVVVGSRLGDGRDQSLASSGGPAPEPPAPLEVPAPEDPPGSSTTTTTTRPADPGSPRATTTTTLDPTTPTTAPRRGAAPVVECTELVSESSWRRTGDRSALEAAAGSSAHHVEVITNRGDEPCRLLIDRCATTAVLLADDGSPADTPPPACSEAVTEVVLQPGDERREEQEVPFPVPPGTYRVEVSRHDGTTALLPVVLDDRLPACPAESLSVAVNESDLFRRLEDVVEAGLDVGLVLSGAEAPCSLRVSESRVALTPAAEEGGADQPVEIVDATERWSAVEPGDEVRTHALVGPVDLAPGDHEGTVTLVLTDGTELVAPFRLLLG